MTGLAIPHLRDPDRVCVGVVFCNDIAQTTGHAADTIEKDGNQCFSLAWHRTYLANQSVHVSLFLRCRRHRTAGCDDRRRTGDEFPSSNVHTATIPDVLLAAANSFTSEAAFQRAEVGSAPSPRSIRLTVRARDACAFAYTCVNSAPKKKTCAE